MNLLSIDVDAEVRKLCREQFASDVEAWLAWTRVHLAAGATELHIRVSSSRFSLDAFGAVFSDDLFRCLRRLRGRASPEQKQAALSTLEKRFSVGVLSVLAAQDVRWASGKRTLNERSSLHPEGETHLSCRHSLTWWGRRDAIKQIKHALSWSGVNITVNQARVSRKGASLFSLIVEDDDFSMRLSIPPDGTVSTSAFVCQGVLVREKQSVSPSGMVVNAVVEDRKARSPGDFRERKALRRVRRSRRGLYRSMARAWGSMPLRRRGLARERLFRWVEHGARAAELRGVPLFRTASGTRLDVEALQQRAQDGVLWAVSSGSEADFSGIAGADQVLVFSRRARSFVTKGLGLEVREPPGRRRASLISWCVARWRHVQSSWVRAAEKSVALRIMGRRVQDEILTQEESALTRDLKRVLQKKAKPEFKTLSLEWTRGRVGVRGVFQRSSGHALRIPRRHPMVKAAVRAHQSNKEYAYPIAVWLSGGEDIWNAVGSS